MCIRDRYQRRVRGSCTAFTMLSVVLLALALPSLGTQPYHELFHSQTLDHFDPSSSSVWPHRYLLNNNSWDGRNPLSNGCKGPILLYTGNEGDITAFWDSNGFMIEELAPKWGGLLVFPEERYYGKSLPFGARSFEPRNLRFLTTAQVLEDIVEIIALVKQQYQAQNCPVIAFGGSYGGTLTALLRAAHPSTVAGGLAASSELGYYDVERWSEHGVDEFTFEDIVIRDYQSAHPQCVDSILQVSQALEQAEPKTVVDTLHLCTTHALNPHQSSMLTYALENFPQMVLYACHDKSIACHEKSFERHDESLRVRLSRVTLFSRITPIRSHQCQPSL
eukprot:TRINITY_DN4216_c0_g2_i2.p1 TRINITY_DN4216_c0_g2~~TRINITY_DN4216_c0_g2_i2.p1  ORF type:complete len:334 (+),score=72.72 TRINITY_DN4216_c0_g2_i2:169-1170(+)